MADSRHFLPDEGGKLGCFGGELARSSSTSKVLAGVLEGRREW